MFCCLGVMVCEDLDDIGIIFFMFGVFFFVVVEMILLIEWGVVKLFVG